MRAAIHQPHYFPYPGFFHKLSLADVFVIMDEAQYDKRYTNRNRILDPHGQVWLSVPIDKSDRFAASREVRINNAIPWREEHWKKLRVSYANSPYFEAYSTELERTFGTDWSLLFDLDLKTTSKVMEWLGIRIPVVVESDLGTEATGTERLVEICSAVGADTYVSGRGGRAYVDEELFKQRNIAVEYQAYSPQPYRQRFGSEFVPDLSVLDMLFNVGPEASRLISRSGGAVVLTGNGNHQT